MRRPIVIVPACSRQSGAHASQTVQDKYLNAVVAGARCMPLVLPAFGDRVDLEAVLATADGIMLTGSASNVHASLYGQDLLDPSLPLDPARDATTLPLIRAAIRRGIPLLAICRGFQEMNVALGGTLHQAVHGVAGMMDHREDESQPLEAQYGPAHRVRLVPGGVLAGLISGSASPVAGVPGGALEIMVNSLHGQGIARLANGLVADALADDGLVEAYAMPSARGYVLAAQWHPEWGIPDNPDSMKLFRSFGDACRSYQANHHPQHRQEPS
jgi:putative glutamine amidotransferase